METSESGQPEPEALSNRIWQRLPPELADRIIGFLSVNEVACCVRPLNKAAAKQFSGPQYTTVHLSQPVPQHAFAAYWGREDAARCLALKERRQLLSLSAASGSIPNLQMALTRVQCALTTHILAAAAGARQRAMCEWLRGQGCRWGETAMQAAAGTGDLEFCQWLASQGCPMDDRALAAAARGGHQQLCEWLLAAGCAWQLSAARAAAEGGHVALLEWMLDREPPGGGRDSQVSLLLAAAAAGCDLPTLQRLFARYDAAAAAAAAAAGGGDGAAAAEAPPPHHPLPPLAFHGSSFWSELRIMAGALSARTPDWRDKVEWLLGRGYVLAVDCWGRAAGHPSWLDHLAWLRGLGLELDLRMAVAAARAGNVGALEFLLGEGGVAMAEGTERHLVQEAVRHGRLEMLRALHARGYVKHADADADAADAAGRYVQMAACRGHAEVLRWLVETLGTPAGEAAGGGGGGGDGGGAGESGAERGPLLTADVAAAAAGSGNFELVRWLWEKGCPWDATAFAAAAEWGSQEMLEWMAAEGCPMGDKGEPYVRAGRTSDLSMLACLHRLGCPFSPTGATLARAIGYGCGLPVLRWLHAHGCPVDWARAAREARHGWRKEGEVLEWIRAQRRAAGLLGGGYLWRPHAAAALRERLVAAAAAQVARLRRLLAAAAAPLRRA